MTQNEVVSVMGSHPDTTINKQLKLCLKNTKKEHHLILMNNQIIWLMKNFIEQEKTIN